jgi:hypothetical protein
VDRRAHERRLDHTPPLERSGQIVALEAVQTRPQSDVRVRRVLILDAPHPLECAWDRKPHPFEEELPGEDGAVQLALREEAPRHCANVPNSRGSDTHPWAAAIPPTTGTPTRSEQSVTGRSREIAPNVTASRIAYARAGPSARRPESR